MSIQQQYQTYKNNSVTTASPGELTLMLYNGCLKFIKQATRNIEKDNHEQKNVNIQKAQKIIQELMVTLDPKAEITKEIMPLYDYINNRLMEANINNDRAILEEASGLVTEFRDTWKEVIKLNRQKQYGQGANI
ncbi:flagellar export chaperone FliS [Sediminibacillus albus]|uniref:Flagellar secretion chaperone FliS n=1 Tax=Sediminibacillus albus TaxID=407036 RepID=A0A1G8YNC0_9BACI|nr:flagellar export chaperone FliS [Sediminibacillus albus]SDK04263.1 flagellar protein FliS [Sediminibacillus albus]